MRRWSLGQLTVNGARPWELVEIAARAGYDAIDPFVGMVKFPGLHLVELKPGDPDTVKMAQALKANGIAFNVADQFLVNEQSELPALQRMVELCADMGAKAANAILFDEDRGRGLANLARLAEFTEACGMPLMIEFLPLSKVRDFQEGLDLLAELGKPNVGLMVDALHLSHSGGSPADIGALGTAVFGAQLCDAPANLSDEAYFRAAVEERMAPGEGELSSVDFMAALPADLTCAIEVPRPTEPDLLARATRLLEAGKACDRRE